MAKNSGWIKVHRQIWDSDVWKSPEPFDERSAWLDLILMANHEDAEIKIGRKTVTIKRGQHHTSYRELARRWHWNTSKVYRFLETLCETQMVTLNGTPNGTLLTVENYAKFQGSRNTKRNTERNTKRNDSRKQTRNIKKENEEKPPSGARKNASGAVMKKNGPQDPPMGDPLW